MFVFLFNQETERCHYAHEKFTCFIVGWYNNDGKHIFAILYILSGSHIHSDIPLTFEQNHVLF